MAKEFLICEHIHARAVETNEASLDTEYHTLTGPPRKRLKIGSPSRRNQADQEHHREDEVKPRLISLERSPTPLQTSDSKLDDDWRGSN